MPSSQLEYARRVCCRAFTSASALAASSAALAFRKLGQECGMILPNQRGYAASDSKPKSGRRIMMVKASLSLGRGLKLERCKVKI